MPEGFQADHLPKPAGLQVKRSKAKGNVRAIVAVALARVQRGTAKPNVKRHS
jgi:hypothetical protein